MSLALNQQVAQVLRQIADLLEQQQASRYRVGAYRRAADTVDALGEGLDAIFRREGMDGLVALPGVGRGIARAVYEIIALGRSSRLENLRGSLDPVRLFRTIPGVGEELAERLHHELQVDTLEALEVAAHDGRLEQVPGIGHRRADAIRAGLDKMLARRIRRRGLGTGDGPPVEVLLDVDREYREAAEAERLPRIAPRRFNPQGTAWLPVLHTNRAGWHFTALYSNTARAHELDRTLDWVVIYYYDDDHHEGQHTVVTETWGPLAGRRVVRGREPECRSHYGQAVSGEGDAAEQRR
ncbi:MAG: helix-hairpin-helix domain-containing protein [Chromatiales bacterium]|jgi:putative hydrolase